MTTHQEKSALILIVDDEPNIHYSFEKMLAARHRLLAAHSAEEGIAALQNSRPDVVVMDVKLPGMDGLAALQRMREIDARLPIVIMTAFGTVSTAITAMKYGAYEYLVKPFDIERMRELIEKALISSTLMRRSVHVPAVSSGADSESGDAMVGSSEVMQQVYKRIGQVAEQDVTVLIRGESGTGKELVARAIYQHSKRAGRQFLEINCAALPENLLEAELFGYEKGAFTGAISRHIGKFEQVNGGTLFLDEIGEMSLMTQAKILRVIQYGTFSRLGGKEVIHTDVRLLVATNRNLEEAIKAGRFREDLYYRLNVITIQLPALRDRREDIPQLAAYFVSRYSREASKSIKAIDRKTLARLCNYSWPGNVRQLENCLRRAVVLNRTFNITAEDLDLEHPLGEVSPPGEDDRESLKEIIDRLMRRPDSRDLWPEMERLLISRALQATKGNQLQAARLLGIHRNTLRNRIQKYGLDSK